ncbi:hypothetical protein JG687_00009583 [Phytophthora cactorum]|uniref:Chromo domain-containing protein n=2 Tax=Phytophthora cactorum TaxID=29920 RepID=A0A8T1U9G3_9STRA|nr:hypothetical protein JG687_00009583 [Phytophthora cactorum]
MEHRRVFGSDRVESLAPRGHFLSHDRGNHYTTERIGGRFAGRRLPAARGARADCEDSDSDGGDANFIVRGGQIAGESSVGDEYTVKRLWAKRRINAVVFFLVEWEDFDELQWIPQKDISWQAIDEFEREYAESVWDHQSTRGHRRTLNRERPTRTCRRIRARVALRRQLA